MPNLIAGRDVVPELVQDNFTPERVSAELKTLLADGDSRTAMLSDFAEVRQKLAATGANIDASTRAAKAVLAAMEPAQ
jgi:lipid-A-disaccharide synthase